MRVLRIGRSEKVSSIHFALTGKGRRHSFFLSLSSIELCEERIERKKDFTRFMMQDLFVKRKKNIESQRKRGREKQKYRKT